MRDFLTFVLFILGLVGGGIFGHMIGVNSMKHEAIANGSAKWVSVERTNDMNGRVYHEEEFQWLNIVNVDSR